MNEILTDIDIKNIEHDAMTNPMFTYYGVRRMNISELNYKGIIRVSDKNLILVKGNLETAYEHIRARHDFWSIHPYPKGTGFQAPNKFPDNVSPIEFVKIADAIYLTENQITHNQHIDADKFDKYQGNYSFDNINIEKVNLILYKGTKIIHSLYTQEKKYTKNRNRTKFPFTRGIVEISKTLEGVKQIHIPYLNIKLKVKYVVLIEKYYLKGIEDWRILVLDCNREYKYDYHIGEKKLIEFKGDTSEKITYQHCDLKQIEDYILKIDKEEKK